jgi:two-component system phosphate regulon sensor histidine kinase PhoR
MITSWAITTVLLTLLIVVGFACRNLRSQLKAEKMESMRLRNRLTDTRQELAEVNNRRKKLLAASTQALIIVESDYTISSANKTAKRMFGKPNKSSTLMLWTRQHQLHEMVSQVFEGEKVPRLYFNLHDLYLEANARPIRVNKNVIAVALAIHDITELQRLSRARREFVANISHELRTPLASTQLLLETLLNGALDDKDMAYKLVNKIALQMDALGQLARELLDLSLIESGQVPLKMSNHSLRSIAETQIDVLTPQAERRNVELNVEVNDDIDVLVDETMIGRVITNLVHNAIKFTEDGTVTISAKPPNGTSSHPLSEKEDERDWVTVSITDTGVGIPPDELPRIFERFYKVDPARNPKNAGTGLGLAIAKHIVEAHGGNIWAESDIKGTTFHFTLLSDECCD